MRRSLWNHSIKPILRYFSTEPQLPLSGHILPPRILFFGTDSFTRTSLQKLCEAKESNPELYTSLDVVAREPGKEYTAAKLKRYPHIIEDLSILLSKSMLT